MSAFSKNNAFDTQVLSGLSNPGRNLLHLFIRTDEHREIGRFGGVRTDRPADASLVEYLGIADESVNMWLGKKVGTGCDQQDIGAFYVHR